MSKKKADAKKRANSNREPTLDKTNFRVFHTPGIVVREPLIPYCAYSAPFPYSHHQSSSGEATPRPLHLSQSGKDVPVRESYVHDPTLFLNGSPPELCLPELWMDDTEAFHNGTFPEYLQAKTQHDNHNSHDVALSDTTNIAAPLTLETRPTRFTNAFGPFSGAEGEEAQFDGGVHSHIDMSPLDQNDLLISPLIDSNDGEAMVFDNTVTHEPPSASMVPSGHEQFYANGTSLPTTNVLTDAINTFQSLGSSLIDCTNEINKDTDVSTKIWMCTQPGCRSRTKFARRYEYNRHMKKHTKVNTIACPVIYCPRQDSKPFYRWDKLFDHLKTAHTESELGRCLVKGCTATNLPLNLLRLHAMRHEISLSQHPDLISSHDFLKVFRSFTMARKCDLKTCKKWFSATETTWIQEHLLTHEETHRRRQQNVIQQMGYDPITAGFVAQCAAKPLKRLKSFYPISSPHTLQRTTSTGFPSKGVLALMILPPLGSSGSAGAGRMALLKNPTAHSAGPFLQARMMGGLTTTLGFWGILVLLRYTELISCV